MSIRAKLLTIILCLSFLPVLVIGHINVSNFKEVLERQTLNNLETLAKYKQEKIVLYLSELQTRVVDFSSDGFVRDSLQRLHSVKNIETILFSSKKHLIENKQPLDKRIMAIDILDRSGKVVISTDDSRLGRKRSEFLELNNSESGIYTSDVAHDSDEPISIEVFSFVYSRTDRQNVVGAISVKFDASLLDILMTSQWLTPLMGGEHGESLGSLDEIYLVNDDQLMINRPRHFDKEPFSISVATEPVIKCLNNGENMNGMWINYHGVEVVGSSRCISMGNFRWVLLSEIATSEAFLLIDEYEHFYLLLIMIVLLLIAVVAIFVTRTVSHPISALNSGVKIIAEGDLNHKVATDKEDEIGELSRAFDYMVNAFKESQIETERVNYNLTKTNRELGFLRDAMDHHAIIAETDVHGVITRVNRRFCEISQYSQDELIGNNHRIVNSGYHPQQYFEHMWKVISLGNVWHGNFRNRRKDGSIYWVSTTIVPHLSSAGEVDRYISLRTDITHQKLIEEKLLRSNRALKASARVQTAILNVTDEQELLDNVCRVLVDESSYRFAWTGHVQHDEQKSILPMAQAGYEEDYLDKIRVTWGDDELGRGPVGRAVRQRQEIIIRDVEKDESFAPWHNQAIERGYSSVIALPLREDGQVFGVIAIYAAERDAFDPDEVDLLKHLADDIAYGVMGLRVRAEHVQAEQALQESELNLKRAQEIAHLGGWEWDILRDKHIWSDEQFRILGYRPGEITPSLDTMLKAVVAEDHQRVVDQMERSVHDGESRNMEFAIVRPDGELRYVMAQLIVIAEKDGETARIAGALLDITDQMRSESERYSLENQLQHSQKLHSIGQLTGGIAHDFNNILSSIMGYTTLAIEECPVNEQEYLGYLEQVSKAGARAQKLIAQLMTFSRRDTREVEHVSPGLLIEDASKMLKTAVPAAIEFDIDIEQGLPDIQANQVQMHQIITNLVINARDAIEEYGKVSIHVRHRNMIQCLCTSCQQPFSGEYVEISVSDTGQGIEPENLVRMFEPFFTTKEVGKGTGMGLSMVHGLVHSHEGHIRVESSDGEGSCFSIYLPIYHSEDEAESSVDEEAIACVESNSGGSILVVDDEESITAMVCSLLNKRGYQCHEENDPEKALLRFRNNPGAVDLLITDQMMPRMNGIEMAREMLSIRENLPIIMCTGFSGSVTEHEVEEAGLKGFVDKPIDFNRLVQMIDELLQKVHA